MTATHARAAARVDSDGTPILLEDQDRRRWDQRLVDEGRRALDRSLRLGRGGPLQVQAAIALLHDEAATPADTDWAQIELLYRRLDQIAPSPVTRLNAAVATGMAHGPAAAIKAIDGGDLAVTLDHYRPLHATRAHFLAELGRSGDARQAYERAMTIEGPAPETELLRRKRNALPL
jgi:RNA polymerase sigma-70 factor (ECF subfamily)